MSTNGKGCRHERAWVIAGPYLWCPDCGAIRAMWKEPVRGGLWPLWSGWVFPRGQESALKRKKQVDYKRFTPKGKP